MNGFIKRFKCRNVILLALLSSLAGCATPPTIDATKIINAKSVALVNIPPMRTLALVGNSLPSREGLYAPFFDLPKRPASPLTSSDMQATIDSVTASQVAISQTATDAAAAGAVASIAGALLQQQAEKTQKRATNFHEILSEANPELNFSRDFIEGIKTSLESKGLNVIIINDQLNDVPKLRWPTLTSGGPNHINVTDKNLETVDADLLIQVIPVAFYHAPGPLNAFNKLIEATVIIYNGKTMEPYGVQRFGSADGWFFSYHRYDSLVEDIAVSGPALHDGLMAIIPEITAVIADK
jgi:hypothetical protein